MRLAFVHAPDSRFLTGTYFSSYFYNFFYRALPRCTLCDYEIIADSTPSAKRLNEFDAVILFSVHDKLGRIQLPWRLKPLLVANAYDSSYINDDVVRRCGEIGIHNFFYHHAPEWFYRHAPVDWDYLQVQMCIERSVYERVTPWARRQSGRVLVSGKISRYAYYELRKRISMLRQTVYVPQHDAFSGDKYTLLLQNFRAHAACCGVTTVNKYFESMASGCLTLCEVNDENGGARVGLRDGDNCLTFKTASEGKLAVEEFCRAPDSLPWEAIARRGREWALTEMSNDTQVAKLVEWIGAKL
jgi:hypothetical protein